MRRSRTSSQTELDLISEDDRQRVILAARASMAVNAFRHQGHLDPRSGAVLSGTGLVQDHPTPTRMEDLELAALNAGACPNRLESPLGPLVCYWSDDPNQRSILDVTDLLLLPESRGRIAALEYFVRLGASGLPVIAPSTNTLLSRVAESVRSDNPAHWRSASLELYDALASDFLVTLAGFVQCKTIGYQDGANRYVTDLLRPSLRMVDSIPLDVLIPTVDRDKVLGVIDQCKESSSDIEQACGAYLARLGHLPLDFTLGIGRVAERWADSFPEGEFWDRVWAWADRRRSPLARYHLCVLFLERPELVPANRRQAFRDELVEVIRGVHGERKDLAWSAAWRVRCDLARHYAHYFECQTPGLESERVANLAWWLAERVGAEFGQDPNHLDRVHSRVVLPAYSLSNQSWELLRPTLQPSTLRFATLHVPSCWSLSLLCQIGQFSRGVLSGDLKAEGGAEFRRALMTGLLGSFPSPGDCEGPVTYAFDRGLGQTADACLHDSGEFEESEILQTVLAMYLANSAPEVIRTRLETIANASSQEQIIISNLIKVLAFARRLPDDLIWEFVTREGWLCGVLESIDPSALDLLFDALVEHQLQLAGRWKPFLQNLLASAVIGCTGDLERRRILFAYCLISSLASGTVEALARILHSEERTSLERDISYWTSRCDGIFPGLPAWGQARMRPVLALLSRMQGNLQVEAPDQFDEIPEEDSQDSDLGDAEDRTPTPTDA